MKLAGPRKELTATPCKHCKRTGIEPGRSPLVCSSCGGVQYVGAATGEMFDDHDSLRLAIKLLRKKDFEIQNLLREIQKQEKILVELKPYVDLKSAKDLADRVYPADVTQLRAKYGFGGYGD